MDTEQKTGLSLPEALRLALEIRGYIYSVSSSEERLYQPNKDTHGFKKLPNKILYFGNVSFSTDEVLATDWKVFKTLEEIQ